MLVKDFQNLSLKHTELEEMLVNRTIHMMNIEQQLRTLASDCNATVTIVTSNGVPFATSLSTLRTSLSETKFNISSKEAAIDHLKQNMGKREMYTYEGVSKSSCTNAITF